VQEILAARHFDNLVPSGYLAEACNNCPRSSRMELGEVLGQPMWVHLARNPYIKHDRPLHLTFVYGPSAAITLTTAVAGEIHDLTDKVNRIVGSPVSSNSSRFFNIVLVRHGVLLKPGLSAIYRLLNKLIPLVKPMGASRPGMTKLKYNLRRLEKWPSAHDTRAERKVGGLGTWQQIFFHLESAMFSPAKRIMVISAEANMHRVSAEQQ